MQGFMNYECRFSFQCVALTLLGVTLAGAPQALAQLNRATGGGVGQELKGVERSILDESKVSKKAKKQPEVKMDAAKAVAVPGTNGPAVPAAVKKDGYRIAHLEIRGDADLLAKAGLLKQLKSDTEGKLLTDSEITGIARKYNRLLIAKGYYLASVWTPAADYNKGILILEVDKGRSGRMTFYQKPVFSTNAAGVVATNRIPFKGAHFSERQLRRRVPSMKEGETFDYRLFYRSVYDVNAHPDITMDTELKVRKEQVDGRLLRFMDAEFEVEEDWPIHAVLSIANTGTELTGKLRPSLTVQHLNLTKHDDILTFGLGPVSLDLDSLQSFAGSYYYPYYWGKGGAWTLYGGYSILDTDQIQDTPIRIDGKGWFVGLQDSHKLINTDAHNLDASLGIVYRYVSDQLILVGEEGSSDEKLEPRDVYLVPLTLSLSYFSGEDFFKGRNFLTSQSVGHFAGFLGASDEEEIRELRQNAEGTYFIERIQAARLQRLFSEQAADDETFSLGEWLLFFKLDAQIASGPLVPAEQKGIGGMDTVRGFPERIALGDNGVSGSLELRTPLLSSFLGTTYKNARERRLALSEGRTHDRLQLVLFSDAGYVKLDDAETAADAFTLASVGGGFRYSLLQNAQVKFDYGYPIYPSNPKKELSTSEEDVSNSGTFHFSAQLQF